MKIGVGQRLRNLLAGAVQRWRFLGGIPRLSWPSLGWLLTTRRQQAWRSMSTGAVAAVSLLLGVSSLLLALLPVLGLPYAGLGSTGALVLAILVFLGGLSLTHLVALLALPKLPPTDVAKVMIGGRTPSEIFRVLAYEVMRLCDGFRNHRSVEALSGITGTLRTSGSGPQALGNCIKTSAPKIRRHLALLEEYMQGREQAIAVLGAMKSDAAVQLAIRPRRLCDHVLRFSPQMFVERVAKFQENWREILAIGPSLGKTHPELVTRILALLEENGAFLDLLADRYRLDDTAELGYAQRLFREEDLHHFVHAFASDLSASSSLSAYACALSHIAATADLSGGPDSTETTHYLQRLRFIHRTQRARAGFSLHQTTRILLGQINPSDQEVRGKLSDILDRMSRHHPGANIPVHPDDRVALERLSAVVISATERSREQICQGFKDCLERFRKNVGEQAKLLIVTHGYSKTVREVIKRTFCTETGGTQRVVILRSDDRDSFGTRLLQYELKQANKTTTTKHPERQPPLDVTVGDEGVLAGLLDAETWTIFLLGAEGFDRTRRVIHPHGIATRLQSLRERLDPARFGVLVVAESYKRHASVLNVEEFYKDHLDQVSLYPPKLVDCILTDQAVSAEDQKAEPVLGRLPWEERREQSRRGPERRERPRGGLDRRWHDRRVA